jgi:hypothetical protein
MAEKLIFLDEGELVRNLYEALVNEHTTYQALLARLKSKEEGATPQDTIYEEMLASGDVSLSLVRRLKSVVGVVEPPPILEPKL